MYYFNVFFVFSIIGFLWEEILKVIKGNFAAGLMYGPWVPIYGAGALGIIFLNRYLKKDRLNKWRERIIFFFVTSILFTILEFITGNVIQMVTGQILWDYSGAFLNYGKYICLEVSLSWGLLATVINYYIYPRMKKYVEYIPKSITVSMIVFFIIDIILRTFKILG